MRKTIGLVVVLLLALAGCAGTNPSGSGSHVPGPVPSPTPSGMYVVEFQRQGGLAGVSDDLVVRDDGGYTITRTHPPVTRSGQLAVTDRDSLVRELAMARLAHVPPAGSGGVADGYTYRLSYAGAHVVAQDGSVDPSLRPLLALLTGIVERYGS
jgi:hypothetical protein